MTRPPKPLVRGPHKTDEQSLPSVKAVVEQPINGSACVSLQVKKEYRDHSIARTPGVRVESCGVRERLRRVLAEVVWQVGRGGRACPLSVLQGAILCPTDGPGRIEQFSIGEIIASQLQLSTSFWRKNRH